MKTNKMMTEKKLTIKTCLLSVICLFAMELMQAQSHEKEAHQVSESFVEKAAAAKSNGNFALAEAYYRQALAKDPKNARASFNLSHLYQDKKKNIESISQLIQTAKQADTKALKHKAFHNLGNAYMDMKNYRQAVNAYKDALRNVPSDDQTRYNLAIAKKKLEQKQQQKKGKKKNQQQQKKKNDSKKKNKDKKGNQKKKKAKNKPGDDKKGKPKPKQPKSQKKKQQQKKQKQQQGQQRKGELSKQQAENLLRAARNLERKVQKKVRKRRPEKTPENPNKKYW